MVGNMIDLFEATMTKHVAAMIIVDAKKVEFAYS